MIINEIMEALKFSQVRTFLKDWDKSRYKSIFSNSKYKKDRNAFRIYIPITAKSNGIIKSPWSNTHLAIEIFLNNNGFSIRDYIKGIAYNHKKNQTIKIGKVLNTLKPTETVSVTNDKGITQNLSLLDAFNVDKTREAVKSEHIVVISRHPYDIAGMSTNRGWTSCMNLNTGQYRKYVPIDIKEGTIVAYVVKQEDKNISNPVGRILIKPFIDSLGSDRIYLVPESYCYGTGVDGFNDAVEKWTKEVNASNDLENIAIFKWNPKFYDDSSISSKEIVTGKMPASEKEQIELIVANPWMIKDIENPSEILQKIAVANDGKLIQYFDNPSFEVQMTAVRENGNALQFIKVPQGKVNEQNVDKRLLAAAVTTTPSIISIIDSPSYDLQRIAVSNSLGAFKFIKDRDKDSKIRDFAEEKALSIYMKDNKPIYIDKENKKIITKTFGDLEDIAIELSFKTLKYVARQYEGNVDNYNVESGDADEERVAELVERKYIEAFRKYLYSADLENGNMDEDEYDSKTFQDMISDSDELSSAISSAAYTGVEVGTSSEMYEDMEKWLNDSPFSELNDADKKKYNVKDRYALMFSIKQLTDIVINYYDEDDNDTFDFDNYMNDSFTNDMDLSDIDEPYYGWSGFDDESAIERFEEEIPREIYNMVSVKKVVNVESINRLKKLAGL
jgi:hypothetical protein